MARTRALVALLALTLALVPLHGAAQAPPAAPVALTALFPDDTAGYLEVQLRPGGAQQARVERLLSLLRTAPDDAEWAWVRLLPTVARSLAVGVWLRGESAGVAAAIAADDPGALVSVLRLAQRGGAPSQPHGDVPIYQAGRSERAGYLAAVGGYVLFANERDALTALIDRARAGTGAGPGLGGTPGYRAAAARLPATRFATGYLDGERVARWFDDLRERTAPGASSPMAPGSDPSQGPDAAGADPSSGTSRMPSLMMPGGLAFGSMFAQAFSGARMGQSGGGMDALRGGRFAAAATAAPEGLRFVVAQPAASMSTPLTYSTGEALQFLPPTALGAYAAHGIGPAMRSGLAEAGMSLNEMLPPGVNLERDLFEWMDGEFGIGLLAPPPGAASGPATFPTVVALFEVRDPPTVEARLRNLVASLNAASSTPGVEPVEERQGDVLVRRLPFGEDFSLTWGYLGRWLFLTTGTAPQLTRAAAAGGLRASPAYNRVARGLPSPNSGVYYADLPGLVGWIGQIGGERFGGMLEDARLREALGLFGTVAGTSTLPRDGWLESIAVLEVRW